MKKFNSKETENKFTSWINQHPESYHSLDIERFYSFVLSLLKNDDYLTDTELRKYIFEMKGWKNNTFIDEFVDRTMNDINDLKSFYDFLNKKGIIK